MISFLLNMIFVVAAFLLSAVVGAFKWLKDTALSVRENPRNLMKLIAVPLMWFYVFTRAMAVYETFYVEDDMKFTETSLTPQREKKLQKYVRMQEKTLFLDRYRNTVNYFVTDDRPGLAACFYLMTYSRRFARYGDLVWNRHCEKIVRTGDQNKIDRYFKKVRWLTEEEKNSTINRFTKTYKTK